MITFLMIVMLLMSVFLILVILVQRGRGGGLAGAFGSGGGASSAFGTKTGDVFTSITVVTIVVYMSLSIILSFQFQKASKVPDAPGVATTRADEVPPALPGGLPIDPLPILQTAPGTGLTLPGTLPPATSAATNPGDLPAAPVAPAPSTVPATRP